MLEVLWKKSCSHENIDLNTAAGYCSDCGEYVKNRWYISRCKCCGIKQKAYIRNGRVRNINKFCKNCGGSIFLTEELETINVIDINYAVIIKDVIKIRRESFIQTWIDQNCYSPTKLLPIY